MEQTFDGIYNIHDNCLCCWIGFYMLVCYTSAELNSLQWLILYVQKSHKHLHHFQAWCTSDITIFFTKNPSAKL